LQSGVSRISSHPNEFGLYLVTLKGSKQAGLTGLKGGIVRKVAVDKTRSSTERVLASLKQKIRVTVRLRLTKVRRQESEPRFNGTAEAAPIQTYF